MGGWNRKLAAIAAAAGVAMFADGAPARAADPIGIAAIYNLTSGGLTSLDVPSLNGAKLKAKGSTTRAASSANA